MPVIIVILGICLLLFLILVVKFNSFLSFVIVSLAVALAEGMTINEAVISIENGIGNTMGFLVLILGLGSMLGKLVSESGAAQRITTKLVKAFGIKHIQLALMLTGFIVGVSLFYDVGFFIMIPLVFTVAASTGLPLLYVGLPMLAALSVTHGYLPPHPAPTAIVGMFHADLGKTMVYGIIVAIPAIVISGPFLSKVLSKIEAKPLQEFVNQKVLTDEEMPGFWVSFFSSLLPVILISFSTIAGFFLAEDNEIRKLLGYFGNPVIAMMLSVLFAIYTLGLVRGRKITDIMNSLAHSVTSITMIMLLIAGAGALKQVLVDGGVSKYIGELLSQSTLSPLFLGWLIATILRFCVGSATVAGITTAGIVLPLVSGAGVSPELMVLAIGSGSLMVGHVNDGGFWLFKEYFNLSIKDTLKTWTVMETSIGITGLTGVMILSLFVK
ncbi:MAG: gluconate:H+ symporter [Bacteroidales bacterium]|nr:gluconate:H+ symporter [Bacteroidales bacterium]MDP3001847.1 gluconate:H+ symporter [Bacteroidales bacterium]